jgi:plastocyanin
MIKQSHVTAVLISAFAIAACGGGDGGGGPTQPPPQQFGTVSGSVTADGAGVANAGLQLSRAGATSLSTTSGANGQFQFTQVATGTWTLAITPPAGFNIVGAPNTTVTVVANQTATANFTLTRPPPLTGTIEVRMEGTAFVSADVTIAAGATIRWRNADPVDHNSTGPGWASGNMVPGATFERVFGQPGTFNYSCTLHPGMDGVIRVQ